MNDHTPDTVGVDISGASGLGARAAIRRGSRTTRPGSRRWRPTAAWVVYESTGPWHRAFRRWPDGCVWLA